MKNPSTSKYKNFIALEDTPEIAIKKVMNMYTDPSRIHSADPGHVEGNLVFIYFDQFDPDKQKVEKFKQRYREGKVGDVELKIELSEVLNEYLEPIRERRLDWIKRQDDLIDILQYGTSEARQFAQITLEEVYRRMGLNSY